MINELPVRAKLNVKLKTSPPLVLLDDTAVQRAPIADASILDNRTDSGFPSKDQYRSMAEKFVTEFPSLATGLNFTDAVSLWRTALSEKFRSERKSVKRQMTNPIEEPPKKTKQNVRRQDNTWGIPLPNFLPDAAKGETKSSLEIHIKWLKSEYSKLRHDKTAINQRMDLTFPERRRLIVIELASVRRIKDLFPCLFEENQFLAEFKRLLSCDAEEMLMKNIKKYSKAVLHLTKYSLLGQHLIETISSKSDSSVKENLAAKAVPILLTVLAKENHINILRHSSQSATNFPTIVYSEENLSLWEIENCAIYINDLKICSCIDLFRATVLLIGAYYIFGLQYPKEASTSYKLIQHLLCGISDSAKKTKKFLRLINVICSSLSEHDL